MKNSPSACWKGVRLLALFASIALFVDEPSTWASEPEAKKPRISSEQLREMRRASDLNEHWSGLDLYELALFLENGELTSVRKSVLTAAANSEVPNALYLISIDLVSDDRFLDYREDLKSVVQQLVGSAQTRKIGELKDAEGEFLRAHIFETVLNDSDSARVIYGSLSRMNTASEGRSLEKGFEHIRDRSAEKLRSLDATKKYLAGETDGNN